MIFCRNVLIYFDQETKVGIFERLAKMMEPDGILMLGAAEIRGRHDRRVQALSGQARAVSARIWRAPSRAGRAVDAGAPLRA